MKFIDLQLDPRLLKMLEQQEFTEATPIQEKCIPLIQEGKDVAGQSGTGSGKTLAFGLPLLEKIKPGRGIQALILTPTRELCVQVAEVLHDFGKPLGLKTAAVYGGVSYSPQIDALKHSDIIVGTPGRILDHLGQRTANFTQVHFLVLDEADKMFEMGFVEAVEEIMEYLAKDRQTVLFSATLSEDISHLMHKHLHSPIVIKTNVHVDKSLLHQAYYDLEPRDKFSLLVHLLKHKTKGLALVFCATRTEADVVAWNLRKQQVHALAIHGGLSQQKRLQALDSLRNSKIDVLVATDVAARGLDIKNVSHVYNYDVPKTPDEYVHRIGRTARAGEEGDAVTLLISRDHDNFGRVLRDRSLHIQNEPLPAFERVPFLRQREESHTSSRGYGNQQRDTPRGGFSRGRSSGSRGSYSREGRPGERRSFTPRHSSPRR